LWRLRKIYDFSNPKNENFWRLKKNALHFSEPFEIKDFECPNAMFDGTKNAKDFLEVEENLRFSEPQLFP
jgi:hypothetical protein